MTVAVLLVVSLALACALIVAVLGRRTPREAKKIVDAIDRILPQTQCEQCGYPGCRPYAEAIANGAAPINQCPPGDARVIRELAALLGREIVPLDETRGTAKPRAVALIEEPLCIGCRKCIVACPVDAIVGAPKLMHTVLTVECTGCELCVPVCPVDCIDMVPPQTGIDAWTPPVPQREPRVA